MRLPLQAVWRGYTLRKRLTRALMLTQISEGDEAFEEVDMDEFIFDEVGTESQCCCHSCEISTQMDDLCCDSDGTLH